MAESNVYARIHSKNDSYLTLRSGNGGVPSLVDMCMRVLHDNINDISELPVMPKDLLCRLLSKCTPERLRYLETVNEDLQIEDMTEDLWKRHCNKEFGLVDSDLKKSMLGSWRNLYMAKEKEKKQRLEALSAKLKGQYNTMNKMKADTMVAEIDDSELKRRQMLQKGSRGQGSSSSIRKFTSSVRDTKIGTTKSTNIMKQAMQSFQKTKQFSSFKSTKELEDTHSFSTPPDFARANREILRGLPPKSLSSSTTTAAARAPTTPASAATRPSAAAARPPATGAGASSRPVTANGATTITTTAMKKRPAPAPVSSIDNSSMNKRPRSAAAAPGAAPVQRPRPAAAAAAAPQSASAALSMSGSGIPKKKPAAIG